MKRTLRHTLCAFLSLSIAQIGFASQTASELITQGRQSLAKQTPAGIAEALSAFKAAVATEPTNAEANFFNAAALLIQEASSSEFQKQFIDIGVSIDDPNLYTLTYSFDSGYRGVLEPEANATTDAHLAYLNSKVDLIDQVLASLDKITDPNLNLTLTAAETSLLETKIDYADVCLLRAGAHLAKAATALGNSYNISVQYRKIYDLFVDGKLNPENVMQEFPLLLTFSATPGQRASAKTSLKAAYGEWQKAYTLLAGRNFTGPAENLFSFVSKEYVDELNDVYFVNLNSSLDAPVEMPLLNPFGYFPDKTSLNLSPFFSTSSNPRSYFPTSYDRGYLRPGTWADPTFGGIFPQGTQGYANDFGVAGWLVQPTIVEPYEFRLLVGNPEKSGFWDDDQVTPLFSYINGIAVDDDGNLYVADSENHVIRKITQDDNVITVLGTERFRDEISTLFVEGTSGNWRLPPGVLQWMGPMTVSKNGTIYFFNESLLWSQSPEGVIKAVAGANGNSKSKGRDGVGGEASFYNPRAITVAPDGSLLVCDGNAIRKVDSTGRVSTIAGEVDWVDDYVNGPSADARFNEPSGIVVGSDGSIFVSEENNGCIRRISTTGVVDTFVGYGPLGELGWWFYRDARGGEARLKPVRLAIDAEDNLYFEDAGTIRKVTPDRMVRTIGGLWGETGFREGVGETARIPSFGSGLAVDRRGTVYIAYNNFVITADSVINPPTGDPFPAPESLPEQTNKPEVAASPEEEPQLFSLRFDTLNVDLSNGPVELPFWTTNTKLFRNLNLSFASESGRYGFGGYSSGNSYRSYGTIKIDEYTSSGDYKINWLRYDGRESLAVDEIDQLVGPNFSLKISGGKTDVEAPDLHDFKFLTSEVNTTDASVDVFFHIQVSDELAGPSWSTFTFSTPNNGSQTIFLSLNEWSDLVAVDGTRRTFQGKLTIPQGTSSGEVTVQSISLSDKMGNNDYFSAGSLPQHILDEKVIVSSAAINTSEPENRYAPWITNITIDKTNVDISESAQKLKARISVNNDISTFGTWISINFNRDSSDGGHWNGFGFYDFKLVSGTTANGIYESEILIPKGMQAGKYFMSSISVQENKVSGPPKNVYFRDEGIPSHLQKTINITGTSDVTAPNLEDITISTDTLDTQNGKISFTADLYISDEELGLYEDRWGSNAGGAVGFTSPSGKEYAWAEIFAGNRISGTPNNGTYQVQFNLPQYSEEGTWTLDYIELRDANYNTRYLIPANLEAEGMEVPSFTVQGHPRGWEQQALSVATPSKQDATIALSNLDQIADGTEKKPIVTTTPGDLAEHVTLTYDGVTTAPTEVGTYTVVAYMNHPNYKGREVATMTIASAGSEGSGSGGSGSGDSSSGDSGSGDSGSGDSGSGDSGSGDSGSGDSGSGDSGSGDSGSGNSGSGNSGSGNSGSGGSGGGGGALSGGGGGSSEVKKSKKGGSKGKSAASNKTAKAKSSKKSSGGSAKKAKKSGNSSAKKSAGSAKKDKSSKKKSSTVSKTMGGKKSSAKKSSGSKKSKGNKNSKGLKKSKKSKGNKNSKGLKKSKKSSGSKKSK